MISVGAERKAKALRCALLCGRRLEERVEKRAVELLVLRRRLQRLERPAQHGLRPGGVAAVAGAVGDEP